MHHTFWDMFLSGTGFGLTFAGAMCICLGFEFKRETKDEKIKQLGLFFILFGVNFMQIGFSMVLLWCQLYPEIAFAKNY